MRICHCFLILSLALSLITDKGISQTKKKSQKTTVAVLDFQRSGNLNNDEVLTLTNRFRMMMVQTNALVVIERQKMTDILREQNFTMSDNCNSAECAVQVGQLLGVEYMIAGDVGKVGDTYTIDIRMIDVNSGAITKTKSEDYVGKIDGLLALMKQVAFSFSEVDDKNISVTDKGSNEVKSNEGNVSEETDKNKCNLKDNSFYFEGFGSGFYYSLNYERKLTEHSRFRIGLSYFNYGSVPVTLTFLSGGKKHFFEYGAGVTYISVKNDFSSLAITGVLGYRYQSNSGFLFRLGATPVYSITDNYFIPLGGVSFGKSF